MCGAFDLEKQKKRRPVFFLFHSILANLKSFKQPVSTPDDLSKISEKESPLENFTSTSHTPNSFKFKPHEILPQPPQTPVPIPVQTPKIQEPAPVPPSKPVKNFPSAYANFFQNSDFSPDIISEKFNTLDKKIIYSAKSILTSYEIIETDNESCHSIMHRKSKISFCGSVKHKQKESRKSQTILKSPKTKAKRKFKLKKYLTFRRRKSPILVIPKPPNFFTPTRKAPDPPFVLKFSSKKRKQSEFVEDYFIHEKIFDSTTRKKSISKQAKIVKTKATSTQSSSLSMKQRKNSTQKSTSNTQSETTSKNKTKNHGDLSTSEKILHKNFDPMNDGMNENYEYETFKNGRKNSRSGGLSHEKDCLAEKLRQESNSTSVLENNNYLRVKPTDLQILADESKESKSREVGINTTSFTSETLGSKSSFNNLLAGKGCSSFISHCCAKFGLRFISFIYFLAQIGHMSDGYPLVLLLY